MCESPKKTTKNNLFITFVKVKDIITNFRKLVKALNHLFYFGYGVLDKDGNFLHYLEKENTTNQFNWMGKS